MILLVTGCTKEAVKKDTNIVACALETSVSSLVSGAIGITLACKNLDAVATDIKAQVSKLNVCKATPAPEVPAKAMAATSPAAVPPAKGALGAVFCAPIVEGLMGTVLAQIPATWECSGGIPADQVKAAVLAACQKAL